MDITYLGHSSFRIKGKTGSVITDPYTVDSDGAPFSKRFAADVVTISHTHDDHNNVKAIKDVVYVIQGPGEYEVKGIGVLGVSSYHDDSEGGERGKNTMYRFDVDGVSVVHLGDLGHVLSAELADELDGVDILLIPVGGVYTIDSKQAVEVVNEINPSVIIPMHYKQPGFDSGPFEKLLPVENFFQEMSVNDITPVPKFSLKRETVTEERQVVLLEKK